MKTQNKYRQVITFIIFLISCLVLPISVYGTPVFEWLGPWQVSFIEQSGPGASSAKAGFGNVTSNTGKASAYAMTDIGLQQGEVPESRAEVLFKRDFALSDSTEGWNVEVMTLLTGDFEIWSPFDIPVGSTFEATVEAGSSVGGISTGMFSDSYSGSCWVHGQRIPSVNVQGDASGVLYDGEYTAVGLLKVSTAANLEWYHPEIQKPDATVVADFMDSFSVDVYATPIPEPTTFMLFLTIFGGFVGVEIVTKKRGKWAYFKRD